MTSKVILTNVQVLAAGTKIDRETDKDKPMPVSVVTLLVDPEAGRAADAGGERRQDSAGAAQSAGSRNAGDAGHSTGRPAGHAGRRAREAGARRSQTAKVAVAPAPVEPVTVEIIRGDKRAREIVRQEQ